MHGQNIKVGPCTEHTLAKFALAAVCLLVSAGCEITASLGQLGDDDNALTEASTGSDGDSSTDAASDESGTGASTTGDSETSTDSETTAESDTADTTETGDALCEIDGSEPLCQICVEQLCCAQLTECALDETCLCMTDCIAEANPPDVCAMSCAPGLAYFEFVQCQAASCAAVCL